MPDRITLTTHEQTTLGAVAWSQFVRMPSSNPGDIATALIPAVESVVAARVAEALRDAANDMPHLMGAQMRLRSLANEYDPNTGDTP